MEKRITELREALRLSQSEFSSKLGLTRSWLSNVELGIRPVQERHIKLILAAFPQVSEEWLRTGAGQMFIQDDSPIRQIMQRYDFPAIVEQLLVAYDRLDQDEQRAVLKYAQELVATIVGASEPAQMTEEEEIDAEVEAYRAQLLAQKKTASSHSSGTGDTAPAIS